MPFNLIVYKFFFLDTTPDTQQVEDPFEELRRILMRFETILTGILADLRTTLSFAYVIQNMSNDIGFPLIQESLQNIDRVEQRLFCVTYALDMYDDLLPFDAQLLVILCEIVFEIDINIIDSN